MLPLLFDDIPRSRLTPMRRGERIFDFYNQCSRSGYDLFRSLMNSWASEFPESDRLDIIARMKRGGDEAFRCGFIELVVHAFLKRLDCETKVHPEIAGSNNKPDFSIVDPAGRTIAYIEVTTVNPPREAEAQENREAPVYNAINNIVLPPGCVFSYELLHAGKASPSLKYVVGEVESWVAERVSLSRERASRLFSIDGWEFKLELLFMESPIIFKDAIGIASGAFGVISPHDGVRSALARKSRRYGSLDAPYLIVVGDAKGQMFGSGRAGDALLEAVLGDEVVRWGADGQATLANAPNGFWQGKARPRNSHVSGVLLFPDLGIWGMRSEQLQPVLAVNPWAKQPLPNLFNDLARWDVEGDFWKFRLGRNFADLIGLPAEWPPSQEGVR